MRAVIDLEPSALVRGLMGESAARWPAMAPHDRDWQQIFRYNERGAE
jgi:hypothetical protein